MPALLGIFALSQVVGISAAGFFLAGTVSIGPFNLISIAERGNQRVRHAPLYKHMFLVRGKRAFIGSSLGGAAAFLVAYFNRPADISLEHSRTLITAATALLVTIPQTVIWMLPIYKALGDETYAGTEAQAKERWAGLMKRFYCGNSIRVLLYTTAYALGIYSLASSKVNILA